VTQVDFYVLAQPQQRALFACRLAEKIYHLGKRVYIHTADEQLSRTLDDLLWTFQSGSFVPHERYQDGGSAHSPVVIGDAAQPNVAADVLINISDELPIFYSRFARVAEIVDGEEAVKLKGRDRFRRYREQGCTMLSHPIDTTSSE
jgi:DNA polymerase III subunit chi